MKVYARSGGTDKSSLRKALREYVKTSGGGSRTLARRMYTSVQAVDRLGNVLNDIVQIGTQPTLTALNLASYAGGTVLDVLSALVDAVAPASGQLDDAMARQAYELMVERVDANSNMNIDSLSPADVQEILTVYIEETIVCRVINDIGAALTTEQHDPVVCANMIEDLYQIVSGAVHNDILSGLSGTNSQLPPDTGQRMENIYQLALDVLSDV
ncbi:Qat anti-phage system associated protein QatB [Hymenobacter sp. B1770]|uniref:Qat anti-phage system associated protein QatB n=1 Tax=Hymenobacter sp. B1770 TaxID=1718788 RepID=UPI003CFA2E13